jgi:hypothetical protein
MQRRPTRSTRLPATTDAMAATTGVGATPKPVSMTLPPHTLVRNSTPVSSEA